jgi:glycosyltransferase involved in cell wall biosynthesis
MTRAAPRVTLILLAYNQSEYLPAAIQACMDQIGEPIEILLSDDASTDGSYELMREMAALYRGPHDIVVRQNETNLGIGEHYNRVVAASRGELLVTAAGDDISAPSRVKTLLVAWDQAGHKPDLIASDVIDMDVTGVELGDIHVADLSLWRSPDDWIAKRPYVIGASHAFTRRMHERFGPFRPDLSYEDQVMALRACCMGGGITVSQPLVRYRRGGISGLESSATTADGFLRWNARKHARQLALYAQIHQDLLTAGRPDLWRGKARRNHARSDLALRLLSAEGLKARLAMGLKTAHAGRLWAIRSALYFSQPALGARIHSWQQKLKRR